MAGRFVRASKYRHVFGRPTRKEQCYDNIRISKNAWDSNLLKASKGPFEWEEVVSSRIQANPQYLSVNWEASGGGAFAVIPLNEKGRLPEQLPLFRGHTAVVLDTDWSPFNDSLIASGSDDGKAFIWKVPEGFTLHSGDEGPTDIGPVSKLSGHSRKIGHVLFNPAAENILATSSGDYTIKLWDVEAGSPRLTLKHTDIVQSLSWSANGALMVTTSRDKKLRIWDVRQEKPAHVVPGHGGAKSSRAVWMGEHDRVATTGFSKMSDRQLALWDVRSPAEPIGGFDNIDSISGVCMPFWDESTQCLYLAGKGDGNIRYYEYENDTFEYLTEYKSSDPQRGIAFLPKRGLNIHENEVMRAFKTVNDSYIEPISFIVPRRAEVFQGDIYPPVVGTKPAMSASEWFGGKDALPPKIDLESVYEGGAPTEVPAVQKAASQAPPPPKEPTPTKVQPEPTKAPSQPSPVTRGLLPSMKEQSSSIAQVASKYTDKERDEPAEEDDSSSFEEVQRPVEQPAEKVPSKPKSAEISQPILSGETDNSPAKQTLWASKPTDLKEPIIGTLPPMPASLRENVAPQSKLIPMYLPPANSASANAAPASPVPMNLPPTPAGGPEPIQGYLKEIKSLLQQQNLTMAAQSEKISQLTSEVDTLKSSLGNKDKDERIRELEKELSALRG